MGFLPSSLCFLTVSAVDLSNSYEFETLENLRTLSKGEAESVDKDDMRIEVDDCNAIGIAYFCIQLEKNEKTKNLENA